MGSISSKFEGGWGGARTVLTCSLDAWDLYVYLRQCVFLMANSSVPDVVANTLSQNEYASLRKRAALFLTFNLLVGLVRIASDFRGIKDSYPSKIYKYSGTINRNSTVRALIYSAADSVLSKSTILPLIMIMTVFHDELNANPITMIVAGLGWLLSTALTATVKTAFMIRCTEKYGSDSFLLIAFAQEVITVVKHAVFVQALAPMLLYPLPEGPFKVNIDAVATRVGYYPNHTIYLEPDTKGRLEVDANAYHVGLFGSSLIIISESLLKIIDSSDIGAVVAHELGHWQLSHSNYGFATWLLKDACGLTISMVGYGNAAFYQSFNFDPDDDAPHPIIGVLLGDKYVYPIVGGFIMRLQGVISYFCEYAADGFAASLGLGKQLRRALNSLVSKAKAMPDVDYVYAAWYHGHPSIASRMRVLPE